MTDTFGQPNDIQHFRGRQEASKLRTERQRSEDGNYAL
jgi:hypothetical protein